MIERMRERVTISIDQHLLASVKRSASTTPGGLSGYLERIIRQHQLREAVRAVGDWYAAHPDRVAAGIAEAEAAEAERARMGA